MATKNELNTTEKRLTKRFDGVDEHLEQDLSENTQRIKRPEGQHPELQPFLSNRKGGLSRQVCAVFRARRPAEPRIPKRVYLLCVGLREGLSKLLLKKDVEAANQNGLSSREGLLVSLVWLLPSLFIT